MNRIICNICGSEYAGSADCCPICGYARQGTEKTAGDVPGTVTGTVTGTETRTKVRGGRYSEKNVKKRQKARSAASGEKEKNPNKPLLIVIAVLLAAILLVSLYIAMRFFRGWGAYPSTEPSGETTQPSEITVPPTVPCAGVVLGETVIHFDTVGQQIPIELTLLPENTTDSVIYESADPAVAVVSQEGMVTAVGSGYTTISITCGEIRKACTVACLFETETTAPGETTSPEETTQPEETTRPAEPAELKLNKTDVSLFSVGDHFTLSASLGEQSVGRSKVTWTSSDPSVATVSNGVVTAVGPGTATITASYDGKKASCVVYCQFEAEDQSASGDNDWKVVPDDDVTIKVGESFRLRVKNSAGETADVTWTASREGIVSISGSKITGRAVGKVTLTATIDGTTFSCIVRVE